MEFFEKSIFGKKPKPREEVEKLSPYSAPLEGRRNLLRLDFNENTIGPSPKVLKKRPQKNDYICFLRGQ